MGGWLLAAEAREKRALFLSAVFPSIRSPGAGRPSAPCTHPYPPLRRGLQACRNPLMARPLIRHGDRNRRRRQRQRKKALKARQKRAGTNPSPILRILPSEGCGTRCFAPRIALARSALPAAPPVAAQALAVLHGQGSAIPGPQPSFAHKKGQDEPEKSDWTLIIGSFTVGALIGIGLALPSFTGDDPQGTVFGALFGVALVWGLAACILPPPFRAPASKERGPPCAGCSARRPSRMRGTPKG